MTLADRLAQPSSWPPAPRKARPSHPDGWTPGIDTAAGTLIATSDSPDSPDWGDVLTRLGLDPDRWHVVDDRVDIRTWDVVVRDADGTPTVIQAWYHKARVEPARASVQVDVDALAAEIRRRGPLKAAGNVATEGPWLVVVLADWQAGKGSGGGPQQLVERLVRLGAALEARARWLRAGDVPVDRLAVLVAGDMVESCTGHYPMQEWETVLHGRDQVKLVRRALVELVDRWAPTFGRIAVAAAPGNHGEKRRGGKAYTSWADNSDIEVVEQAAEVWAANPGRFGHVGVLLPDPDDLTVTVDLDGTVVAVAHGHQCRKGTGVQGKVLRWWGDMAQSRHPVGDADVLVTGHFHHLELHVEGTHDGGTRTWMQAPALDGGSPWWEHQGGGATAAGTLTFVAGGGSWSHWHVIPAD